MSLAFAHSGDQWWCSSPNFGLRASFLWTFPGRESTMGGVAGGYGHRMCVGFSEVVYRGDFEWVALFSGGLTAGSISGMIRF